MSNPPELTVQRRIFDKGNRSSRSCVVVFLLGERLAGEGKVRLAARVQVIGHGEQIFRRKGHKIERACRVLVIQFDALVQTWNRISRGRSVFDRGCCRGGRLVATRDVGARA